ncbi:DUF1828 domain-containing protein [Roseateles sp. UC29_93]|uniref:DUF1828 domain-containing protein n=1 Tax=Roseateles sp. UC29_93 TaxID=3350177 RepID=UPI00366B4678
MTVADIQERLCKLMCLEVRVVERRGQLVVSLPFEGRDGDHLVAHLKHEGDRWRISDRANTLMRLSYENDLSKLLSGARGKLYEQVLRESGIAEDDGELFVIVDADDLARGLFRLGRGMSRLEDLGLWSRGRVESTFYDDLNSVLRDVVGRERLIRDYVDPDVPESDNYPIDFFVQGIHAPLYVFGVKGADKARLTTITLQHLKAHAGSFDSLVVVNDLGDITKPDIERLAKVANDMVFGLDDTCAIREKIDHRLRA